MKRAIAFAFVIAAVISLASCTKTWDKDTFFSYQDGEHTVSGIWKEDGKEYGVTLTMGSMIDGEREKLLLTFDSPDTVEGMKFAFEAGDLSATLGDLTLSLNEENRERVFRLSEIFSFSSEEINSITPDREGNTVATGKKGEIGWRVVTNKNALPTLIEYGDMTLEIESFK